MIWVFILGITSTFFGFLSICGGAVWENEEPESCGGTIVILISLTFLFISIASAFFAGRLS